MSVKIIVGADIVPTYRNFELFQNADVNTLIGEDLKKLLDDVDLTAFNLETPLIDEKFPIQKCGPNLLAPTKTINGIRAINKHFFTLANNHIFDQGEKGLYSTIELLKKNNIDFAGAGKNLAEAREPFIKEIDGIKIGIYCCAEHEFSIAKENSPGANPFDPLESLDHISKLKEITDYTIVLYHGGKEHYRYPSPYLQKVCRKIVDKGADLVVCQHSHCIGCEEKWNGSTIVYGQGNFLFDDSESEFWKTGILIETNLEKNNNIVSSSIRYYPICKLDERVRLAPKGEQEHIISDFKKRSNEILNYEKLKDRYRTFAKKNKYDYLNAFYGKKHIVFRILNKLSGYKLNEKIMKLRYGDKEKIIIKNFIECEAHRELVIESLNENEK